MDVGEVSRAVQAIMEPGTSNEVRVAAHNLCEQVKNHPQAFEIGILMAKMGPSSPLPVRLFGINVVEGWIRTRLDPVNASPIIDGVWSLLSLVLDASSTERRLLQEKVASIIAQLASRVWPQYWPDLFDRLLEMIPSAFGQDLIDKIEGVRMEMALLMVRMVVDEVHPRIHKDTIHLDEGRRPELQKAFLQVLPPILARLSSLTPGLLDLATFNSSIDPCLIDQRLAICIEAQIILWNWIPFDSNGMETAINLHSLLINISGLLKRLPNASVKASECLLILAERTVRPHEAAWQSSILSKIIEPVHSLLSACLANSEDQEMGYAHFRRIADYLCSECVKWAASKKSIVFDHLGQVLETLIGLSNMPSILVASACDTFWMAATKNSTLVVNPVFLDKIGPLVSMALRTSTEALEKSKPPFSPYDVIDFPPTDQSAIQDYATLHVTRQSRVIESVKNLAVAHPIPVLEYCLQVLLAFLSANEKTFYEPSRGLFSAGINRSRSNSTTSSNCDQASSAEAPSPTLSTQTVNQWNSLMLIIDTIVGANPTALLSADVTQRLASTLLNENLVKAMDHTIAYHWCQGVGNLLTVIGQRSDNELLNRFFRPSVSFMLRIALVQGNEELQLWPENFLSIRGRSQSTIVRIARIKAQVFMDMLPDFVSKYQDDSVNLTAQQTLIEVMLYMVLLASSDDRFRLMQALLFPLVSRLRTISFESGKSSESNTAIFNLLHVVLQRLSAPQFTLLIKDDDSICELLANHFVPAVAPTITRVIMFLENSNINSSLPIRGIMYASRGLLFSLSPLSCSAALIEAYNSVPGALDGRCEIQLLTSSSGSWSLVDWTMFIKSLVTPLASNVTAHSPQLKALMLMCLDGLFMQRLNQSVEEMDRLASSDEDEEDQSLRSECNSAVTAVVNMFYDLLIGPFKAADSILEVGNNPMQNCLKTVPETGVASWLLKDEQLSCSLCSFLTNHWSRSPSILKALCIVSRLLPTFMFSTQVNSSVGPQNIEKLEYTFNLTEGKRLLHKNILFSALPASIIAALGNPQHSDAHPVLTNLLTELVKYSVLFRSNQLDLLLASLPIWASPMDAAATIESMKAFIISPNSTIKMQRMRVRTDIARLIRLQALSASGVTTIIPPIPQRLVFMQRAEQRVSALDENAVDLGAFFDN